MYALDSDDGNYWIYRFMIDQRFQRQGFGRAGLALLIQTIFDATHCPRIMLGVKPANSGARRLYERAGFVDAAMSFDGEDFMVLDRGKG